MNAGVKTDSRHMGGCTKKVLGVPDLRKRILSKQPGEPKYDDKIRTYRVRATDRA